jgi:CHASE3 domain sensor protein
MSEIDVVVEELKKYKSQQELYEELHEIVVKNLHIVLDAIDQMAKLRSASDDQSVWQILSNAKRNIKSAAVVLSQDCVKEESKCASARNRK